MMLEIETQIKNWETSALRSSGNVAIQCFETGCGDNNLPSTGWVERDIVLKYQIFYLK